MANKPDDGSIQPTKPSKKTPRPADSSLVIVVSSNAGVIVTAVPRGKNVKVGRAADCDLAIDDESVSRYHVLIEPTHEPILVEDIGSMNGTRIAGRTLIRGERAELAIGEPLGVGDTTLYVLHAHPTLRVAPPTPTPRGRVVRDPAMQRLYALLDVIAVSPLSILILGETGVGKEVFAEAIHQRSGRASQSLLKLNCAALPESIIEAELFGYEKGAFTGATATKPGLFEAANGGTVMLDEVGDLPSATQAKLLRVLETGEVLRIGSVKTTTVDVRFISATNVDLRTRIDEGRFRADLYYRLDGMSVVLPPLRERIADIEPLARVFAARVAEQLGRAAPDFERAAIDMLEGHAWPGNVRELKNVIERAVVFTAGKPTIVTAHLASIGGSLSTMAPPARTLGPLKDDLDKLERERVVRALDEAAGNQTRAAKLLGISRHALIDRLERYGIARPRKPR